jgi:CRP-like cAMP-binding protein
MAKHAYHDHLIPIPLFAGLNEDELDAVAHASTQLDFKAGTVITKQGGLGHEMYIVLEGTLEVVRDDEHIADIGEGGFAGELAQLTHTHRTADVIAKTDVSLLHIDGREFSGVIDAAPRIAAKLLPVVAARWAENVDHTH